MTQTAPRGTFSSLEVWYPEVMVKKRRSNIANRLPCLSPSLAYVRTPLSLSSSLHAVASRLVSSRLVSRPRLVVSSRRVGIVSSRCHIRVSSIVSSLPHTLIENACKSAQKSLHKC
ncbi:hypothetical protein FJTKL_06725 [Diaporthe vaccinii]|uniref:Uncharacterized protein n=1 Tax=Diaporthe vaccinii TaxID=105482 RepID=A0ABR4EWC7_9PEZI